MYSIYFSPLSKKDAKNISKSGLKKKAEKLLEIIKKDPYAYPPQFEILKGELKGYLSRRINKQHRLVYKVLEEEKIIKVIRMWTHYSK
ncbi:MAG: Txe/YoeB family addiction module toxin [Bacteroidetes bacterium]|nr:Txe/YoeB family addiction module toxin [Bacteroidota bacterium]MBL7103152.1 Txe/YoeB family addiction module toxin [Bacteroidales bacterium]